MDSSQAIKDICESLLSGNRERAEVIAHTVYPFKPTTYKEISAHLITEKIREAKKAARLSLTIKPAVSAKRKWDVLSYTKLFVRVSTKDKGTLY
jgi:hypothetical protein